MTRQMHCVQTVCCHCQLSKNLERKYLNISGFRKKRNTSAKGNTPKVAPIDFWGVAKKKGKNEETKSLFCNPFWCLLKQKTLQCWQPCVNCHRCVAPESEVSNFLVFTVSSPFVYLLFYSFDKFQNCILPKCFNSFSWRIFTLDSQKRKTDCIREGKEQVEFQSDEETKGLSGLRCESMAAFFLFSLKPDTTDSNHYGNLPCGVNGHFHFGQNGGHFNRKH